MPLVVLHTYYYVQNSGIAGVHVHTMVVVIVRPMWASSSNFLTNSYNQSELNSANPLPPPSPQAADQAQCCLLGQYPTPNRIPLLSENQAT